jgi:hypothetical protein
MEDRETLAFGFVDDVYVVIHRGSRVAEDEWQHCLEDALYSSQVPRLLFVAGDLMPDVAQRCDLARLHERHATRVALLSDGSSVQRVVTALKWSGIEADGFRMDDLDGMLTFLGRPTLRARLSSALGPYLERSWLHENAIPSPTPMRARQSAAHRGIS